MSELSPKPHCNTDSLKRGKLIVEDCEDDKIICIVKMLKMANDDVIEYIKVILEDIVNEIEQ